MSETIHLDQLVDPFEAKVVVVRDADGAVADARFDLSGLPRLDPMLAGKDVAGVPDLVKMLCGICPVAHHLAGVAALESLAGIAPADLPRAVREQRLILHHGSVLDSMAARFIGRDRDFAVALRRAGKLAMAAAGAPGHFPDVAVPGGVRVPVDAGKLTELHDALAPLADSVTHLLDGVSGAGTWADAFGELGGLDVAVVDADGRPDPLGGFVGLAGAGESGPRDVTVLSAERWAARVTETRPGAPDPRPVIELDGRRRPYRVGPIARLAFTGRDSSVGPLAAQFHAVADSVAALRGLAGGEASSREKTVTPGNPEPTARTGIGLVDGPRGLLAHEYGVDAAGTLTGCRILTPTAQNERWLADMLRRALADGTTVEGMGAEGAIRAADPCLPCTSAPEGGMGVTVEERSGSRSGSGSGSGSGTGTRKEGGL